MTFNSRPNLHRPSERFFGNSGPDDDDDDKSSLEAAAEAAAKVNAMLIAKGMLKPNQVHSGIHNVVTKKIGGPNSLVVAEVEINYLPLPCRNTLTRGTTQEEISKASGASVTTRGRYMTDDDRARNPRDRCLYLNIQASKKESVDVAVEKINEIIKSTGGDKMNKKGFGGFHSGGGGRFRSPPRPNFKPRFGMNNLNVASPSHPPPLMSLPNPQLQVPPPPPPHMPQVMQQPQIHLPPPPTPMQVTVMLEKLYVGLEHAPPNFDTKNKLLGPGGIFLQHIQNQTGCNISLRGKGSGFLDLNGADAFEPMHVNLEHSSLAQLQEAKKLAENLIQTVQQSYVSFQQALAALPPSMPTGLITGVPQQPSVVEHHPLTVTPSGLATIATAHEQPLQTLQPQALGNSVAAPTVVIPSSMTLQMPIASSLAVSAAPPPIMQQPAPLDLVGQQPMLISHHQAGPPQAMLQQVVPTPQPQPVPPPPPGSGATMATAYATVQQAMQLVSQAPPTIVQQPAPTLIAQPPPQVIPHQPQPMQSLGASMAGPTSVVYTVASSCGHGYYSSLKDGEESKRRFREEKDDKIPENLLGYQHGPPHLVNLVRSSPPPHQPQPVPPPPISQPLGTQIIQQPHQGVVMSHMHPPPGLDQGQFAHLGGQTTFFPGGQMPLMTAPPPPQDGQQHQFLAQHQPQGPSPTHQFVSVSAPPPHHYLPPPLSSPSRMSSLSPSRMTTSSPSGDMRSLSQNDKSLMPPPPPRSGVGSPSLEESSQESKKSEDKESGVKRKSNGFHAESEKKKIKGVMKNKHEKSQEAEVEERNPSELSPVDDEQNQHPASPQYQGQPLRYPNMPSDPNIPPQLQEMGMHGPRPPHQSPLPPNVIPPGHHLVQPSDPNLLPQIHHPPPPHPQHIFPEGPRQDVPPPTQIMIEHSVPHGGPVHITHHRPPGTPAPMHLEQHPVTGAPLPPRQIILEHHPHPPPNAQPLEQHLPPQAALHAESLQHPQPQGVPVHAQPPPPHQEVLEYEVRPSHLPPPFQSFESIPVSALSQPEPQTIIQQGPAVITVSSAPHYIPYSIATISAQTAPPPPQASFTVAPSSGQIPMYSQQPLQQQQQHHPMMTAPPPVPQSTYSFPVPPPTSTSHFQAQFSHPPQQVLPPPPAAVPVASQPQFHQPHPQSIHYLTS